MEEVLCHSRTQQTGYASLRRIKYQVLYPEGKCIGSQEVRRIFILGIFFQQIRRLMH